MHVAGRTGARTTADRLDRQAVLADHLHHAPALDGFQHVRLAVPVVNPDEAHDHLVFFEKAARCLADTSGAGNTG
jgi:hypothetical protein